MRAGTLKDKLEFWGTTETQNSQGDTVLVWIKKYSVRGFVDRNKASSSVEGEKQTDSIEATFIIRYQKRLKSIDTAEMIIYSPLDDEWYDIKAPLKPGYRRTKLIIKGELRKHPPEELADGV